MRDPARIKRILDKLNTLWNANPDQRLGQLIANLSRPYLTFRPPDIFNVEDDRWEELLDKKLKCLAQILPVQIKKELTKDGG